MTDTLEKAVDSSQNFGEKLQIARESLNLSRQEAASRLRLSPNIIHAFENNDFKTTPSNSFTRGYFKSYAKMLEFSEQEINAALSNSGLTFQNRDFIANALKTKISSQPERYLHVLTGLVIFVLSCLIVFWWKSHTYLTNDIVTQISSIKKPTLANEAQITTPTNTPATITTDNSLPEIIPVTIPDAIKVPIITKSTKNPRKTPPFTDIINTISEPGLEPN